MVGSGAGVRASLLVLSFVAAPAQADLSETADAYLAAIRSERWIEMANLLTPNARYQDYSMEYFDVPMIDLVGTEAVVGFWRDSAEDAGTTHVAWTFDERFEAGPNLFLIGHASVVNQGAAWGFPGQELKTRFRQVTHLRIADGKVAYHVDHVDYPTAARQMTKQTEAIVATQGAGEPLRWENPLPEDGIRAVAEAYLAALAASDLSRMASLLALNSRYREDSIESVTGAKAVAVVGREAIVDSWKAQWDAAGVAHMGMANEHSFVAGPNFFSLGNTTIRPASEATGKPGQALVIKVRHIVHLRVEAGRVTYHAHSIDRADYQRQLSALTR